MDQAAKTGRFLGSLRDALAAASRDERPAPTSAQAAALSAPKVIDAEPVAQAARIPSAAEAARDARAGATPRADRHVEVEPPPTTRVLRAAAPKDADRTKLVRGKSQVVRGEFEQDPVVGWLVVVGGPGLGSYRPIYEGNNAMGRASHQRIPIDFGDDAISSEEQAFIRYDSADRSFLFVPNLSKTNVVSLNDKRPTAATPLSAMDVITIGRTQLVFVPFCGQDFDWSDIADSKG
jgi:hypothetical protein